MPPPRALAVHVDLLDLVVVQGHETHQAGAEGSYGGLGPDAAEPVGGGLIAMRQEGFGHVAEVAVAPTAVPHVGNGFGVLGTRRDSAGSVGWCEARLLVA